MRCFHGLNIGMLDFLGNVPSNTYIMEDDMIQLLKQKYGLKNESKMREIIAPLLSAFKNASFASWYIYGKKKCEKSCRKPVLQYRHDLQKRFWSAVVLVKWFNKLSVLFRERYYRPQGLGFINIEKRWYLRLSDQYYI